jgi:hypothetical protein
VTSPDRLAVPTNGHRPALKDDTLDAPSIEADFGAQGRPASVFPTVSPGQVVVGFGIIAALIVLLFGRRRRG